MVKIALLLIVLCLCSFVVLTQQGQPVSGIVVDSENLMPVAEARVRFPGSNDFVLTNAGGEFTLYTDKPNGSFVTLAAGKRGWFNKRRLFMVGQNDTIKMEPLPEDDNPDFVFQNPTFCRNCHAGLFNQWSESKHARATTNSMLKQIYNGTDVNGNTGVYPGFKLNFPNEGGDCGDCHAPSAALRTPGNTEMNDVWNSNSIDTAGVFCDFCHKIDNVEVNYATGVNGSIFVKRPFPHKRDINYGQFDDVTTDWMGGTYNDVYEKSAFCSGCHQYANRYGVIVDDTYDSWAASSFAAQGIQCQDCHMRPNSDSIFAGGIAAADAVVRDTNRVYSQFFKGTTPAFMDRSAKLAVEKTITQNRLSLKAMVTNVGAGHKLPTGVSFRNMFLVVKAENNGQMLTQLDGDTIPFYGGVGDPNEGNLSGLPGKGFTLFTRNENTGDSPTTNWFATEIIYDSRIPAGKTDTSSMLFKIGKNSQVNIQIQLVYRAVYKAWADVKGWDMREYVMIDTSFQVQFDASVREPEKYALHQNYPNPFNGDTRIKYDVPENNQTVSIKIYNVIGQEIRTVENSRKDAGQYTTTWDGKNSKGQTVASGLYFYRMIAGKNIKTKKLLFIK